MNQNYYVLLGAIFFSMTLVVILQIMPVHAKSIQDLMDENQANQTYRAELESYILSHKLNASEYVYDKDSKLQVPHDVPLSERFDLDTMPLDQLERIVKAHIATGSISGVLVDIENERLKPALDTLSDVLNSK
jgi:hypothetical protein